MAQFQISVTMTGYITVEADDIYDARCAAYDEVDARLEDFAKKVDWYDVEVGDDAEEIEE